MWGLEVEVGVGSRAVGSRMEARGAGITNSRARTRRNCFRGCSAADEAAADRVGFPSGRTCLAAVGWRDPVRGVGVRRVGVRRGRKAKATVQRRRARGVARGTIQRRDEGVHDASERARGESRANDGERRTRVRGRRARVARRDANHVRQTRSPTTVSDGGPRI